MIWMLLVLLYGLLKGAREIAKKKAMQKNSVMEVLVVYTILSFVMVIPQAPKAGGLEPPFYFYIAIKSFCIFLAWICSFRSLKKLPVSLYGVLDLSRILFATLFGLTILGETLGIFQIFGLVFVCLGLLLLKFKPRFLKKLFKLEETQPSAPVITNASVEGQIQTEKKRLFIFKDQTTFYVFIAFISCFLNAISGLLDKILMKDITSSQLQFWYMVFLVAYYVIYILLKKEKIGISVLKNPWVWLLAIMFVIGDKALFIANGMADSRVTIMTLIKQSGCLVTILGGRFVFKEKNTGYKLFCASIIILGIVLGVL